MNKKLLSFLLMSQMIFLNASESNAALQIDEIEKFRRDLHARNIATLTTILQQALTQDEHQDFSRFYITENHDNILHIAAASASVDLARVALQVRMDVHQQDCRSGQTPLHAVLGYKSTHRFFEQPDYNREGRLVIAKMLLDAGAEINRQNFFGFTPLDRAIFFKNVDLVELFLKNGAQVNFDNRPGDKQPLYYGIRSGSLPIVQLLLKYGANPAHFGDVFLHDAWTSFSIGIEPEIKKIIVTSISNLIPCTREKSRWESIVARINEEG